MRAHALLSFAKAVLIVQSLGFDIVVIMVVRIQPPCWTGTQARRTGSRAKKERGHEHRLSFHLAEQAKKEMVLRSWRISSKDIQTKKSLQDHTNVVSNLWRIWKVPQPKSPIAGLGALSGAAPSTGEQRGQQSPRTTNPGCTINEFQRKCLRCPDVSMRQSPGGAKRVPSHRDNIVDIMIE